MFIFLIKQKERLGEVCERCPIFYHFLNNYYGEKNAFDFFHRGVGTPFQHVYLQEMTTGTGSLKVKNVKKCKS